MKNSPKFSQRILAKCRMSVLVTSGCLLVIGGLLPSASQMVMADSLQAQINALSAQNDNTQSVVSGLQAQASSYQNAIAVLQQQITGLQSSIDSNQAEQASLQQQIIQDQQQIDHEKTVLADDVKTMYVDGTPSTLEVLATSKDLSDFVDKQEYRTSVQNKLQDTLQKIAQLQQQLQDQKAKIDQLVTQEKQQQSQLAATQAQQASLLSYNQSQQASYNAQIQANSSKIAQLRAQQAAENATIGHNVTAGDPNHGGYPGYLDNAAQDSIVDPWGMFNRECVSYAAWKVQQTYGDMPNWGGQGNAIQWIGDAQRSGIPTKYGVPGAHTVAIWNVGAFGHAMWVEAVNSDGSIYVSQYNYSYNGRYSEMYVSPSQAKSFTYLYFN